MREDKEEVGINGEREED